ncbi:MAG: GAF domain-containing protein [Chlamydiales bacterium]|nr:GAF domain-containing protein [Chlamydiales bacterium]
MKLNQAILQQLNEIGIALTKERQIPVLHEKILRNAKELTHADGGTIYTVVEGVQLRFEIVISDSLHFHLGGTSSNPIPFPNLPLYLETGEPNDSLMVAYAVNHNKTINVKDAYHEVGFDFSGTRRFDAHTGYRTKAVLTIPMRNHQGEVIAVLQLINPIDPASGEVSFFSEEEVNLAESLASQAGLALNNQLLIQNLRRLFESLIRVISEAIDEKSPSTGNHGKRVPIIAQLLAQAVNDTTEGPLKDVSFTSEQLYELQVASLLHDCGKITTPVHIIEKKKKLETIHDRVEIIDARFNGLRIKEENALLKRKLAWIESHFPQLFEEARNAFSSYELSYRQKLAEISDDQEFVHRCNEMIEPITNEAVDRINRIASLDWNKGKPLLTNDEKEHLLIPKGNLSPKEREIIQHHVIMTYRMLSQLPFPKEMRAVPEIAASHHERVDGKGYPRGLKGDEMLVQSKILAIADIFESLSAPDRPYRNPAPLSQVFKTMREMVDEGHLDPDLYDIFLKKKVYLNYATRYLIPQQLDVD